MNNAPQSLAGRSITAAVVIAAAGVAVIGARPFAASWNDGASLATVEALVDQQTFAIDNTIFVKPALRRPGSSPPYSNENAALNERGTLDKVYVDGHYYAAKPFVPALLMAGEYWLVQQFSGLQAAHSPAAFVYVMTLLSTGLAYGVAVTCMYALFRRLLPTALQAAALAIGFGLGSLALVYSRHVNGHLQQLAAVAALCLALHVLAARLRCGQRPWAIAALVGSLIGLAYVFDQGIGPALLLCVVPLVAWRTLRDRRTAPLALVVAAAAAPWIVAQHWLNYELGHTIAAINSKPEHFAWPGSPWTAATLSGGYDHDSPSKFIRYALQMLVGKKGFLLHNPLLFAAIVGSVWLVVRRGRRLPELPEIVCGGALGVTMWLVYSWGSTNYSGDCVSVRWFLPALAPGYYALAIYLRERPKKWDEVLLVGGWSVLLNIIAWNCGPWWGRTLPPLAHVGAMLLSWFIYAQRAWLIGVVFQRRQSSPAEWATAARRS